MLSIEAPHSDSYLKNPNTSSFHNSHSIGRRNEASIFKNSDDESWHSIQIGSVLESGRSHCASSKQCSDVADLETGAFEVKVCSEKVERLECRICQLGMENENDGGNNNDRGRDLESPIQLGCCCRGDLGIAHKQCAQSWFSVKGNTICEICGETAQNIEIEPSNVIDITFSAQDAAIVEQQTICDGNCIKSSLLGCMLLAINALLFFTMLIDEREDKS